MFLLLVLEQPLFDAIFIASGIVSKRTVGLDNAMARNKETDRIASHCSADRASTSCVETGDHSQLFVRNLLSELYMACKSIPYTVLEIPTA